MPAMPANDSISPEQPAGHGLASGHCYPWLIQLGEFVLTHHRVPRDDEGWAPLDGSCGIKLLSWERFEHDREDFEIREEPLA